ncbi:heterogeneous nuclear ribonucleoprotein d-, partial [Lynx pardinus]
SVKTSLESRDHQIGSGKWIKVAQPKEVYRQQQQQKGGSGAAAGAAPAGGVVPGIMDEVSTTIGTKDLVTIMIKDMEITIVPMVVIKSIGAMAAMLILDITMTTMDMNGQGYADHSGQQSTYGKASGRHGNHQDNYHP